MPADRAAESLVPSFNLDCDWIVLSCNVAAAPWLADAVRRRLWDVWPSAEPLFRPMYEKAWRDGYNEGSAFFNGVLLGLEVTRVGDELVVAFEQLDRADLTSVATLVESLDRMRRLVDERAPDGTPSPRPSLRPVAPPEAS